MVWCRKWERSSCRLFGISKMVGKFRFFWWVVVVVVLWISVLVSLGLKLVFLELLLIVCESSCLRVGFSDMICILIFFGKSCWIIVWLRVLWICVVSLLVFCVCVVWLVMFLMMVCILWICIFLLSSLCRIFCKVLSGSILGIRFLISLGIFLVRCFSNCCIFWWLSSLVVWVRMRWLRWVVIMVEVLIMV